MFLVRMAAMLKGRFVLFPVERPCAHARSYEMCDADIDDYGFPVNLFFIGLVLYVRYTVYKIREVSET